MSRILHTGIAGGLLGVTLYLANDVAGEISTYIILRDQAYELAQQSESLKAQIGSPYTLGPWWNARIGKRGPFKL